MPNCPKCEKPVYFAERLTSLGKDWHRACLRCEKCNKTLTPGSHAEHEGKPYCNNPCYGALFGPGGFWTWRNRELSVQEINSPPLF
ncbi:cysteine-rich protein 1 [Caerostris extrusa]|uniref:Cysteine-rich protein 1 n=1 Tax=Caerostris extrusa TaxID=172846 RepID=A0AAV4X116_CAEEX|nr:cysteine-rich protein 1 [Caerostris extrusa]